MGSQFLKSFALDLGQEVDTLGQLAFQAGGEMPVYGQPVQPQAGPQAMQPQQPQAPVGPPIPPPMLSNPSEALPPEPAMREQGAAPWQDVQQRIFDTESNGDYDALFGFANQPGGDYEGTRLTDMTVDEAINFSNPKGKYANYVKGKVGRVATPMGAYQIVGTTLRAAKKQMGLSGDERMTPELQDTIGEWIYQTQGEGAWEGLKNGGGATMSSRNGLPTRRDSESSVDTSDMEADLPDMSPEAQKRRHIGAVISAIGKGLGQMSRGDAVDISDVMNDYLDRQMEMRQRVQEINMERRRQTERKEGRQQDVADQDYAFQAQEAAAVRSSERGQAADIRQEGRALENAKKATQYELDQRLGIAATLTDDPNDPMYNVGKLMEASRGTMGFADAFKQLNPDPGDLPGNLKEFGIVSKWPEAAQEAYFAFKKKSGSGDTFNIGENVEAVGAKAAFEDLGKDKDAIRANKPAYEAYKTLSDLFGAYPNGGVPTGALEGLTIDARSYLKSMGLLNADESLKVDLQTTINSLGSRLIGSVRVPGTGSTSDLEFTEFMKSIPNISKTPLGNQIMTQIGLNNYLYSEQVVNLKEEYIRSHGGSTVGFDKEVKKAEQDGTLQASFYSGTTPDILINAINHGNLKVGDLIKSKNGQFVVLDQNGYDQLMSEE